jgi:hypothetical protein
MKPQQKIWIPIIGLFYLWDPSWVIFYLKPTQRKNDFFIEVCLCSMYQGSLIAYGIFGVCLLFFK